MALEIRQSQKLAQKLVLTQQLQQAIELLVLNSQELIDAVNKELLENPALEEVPGTRNEEFSEAENALHQQAARTDAEANEQNNGQQEERGVDWNKVLEEHRKSDGSRQASSGSRHEEMPPIEATLATSHDLSDHLMWQLNLQSCTDAEFVAAEAIIHNLDHRGYLDLSIDEIRMETGVHADAVEGALMILRGFDPIGVATRDLMECLLVQARHHWPEDEYFVQLITNHLGDLERRDYPAIARAMGVHEEDVVEYHRMIKTLEPWPGRPYSDAPDRYIIPDISVEKVGDEWRIVQNDDGMPRLRVSAYYQKVLTDLSSSKDDKAYIKERLESADFLIKSIYKRQRTIHKVMECILDRQRGFFEGGAECLKPLVLRDIADEIGVHESTVSRVTTNKYVQCSHGIFELKYFFNAGISRLHGEDLAAEAVRQKIKKLIAEEDGRKPLSDQKIVQMLVTDNIKIARRTVAKYREGMGILPSSRRKRVF
jgi:RNA polymerase sigma-54 factor